jgi:hypothetical protein
MNMPKEAKPIKMVAWNPTKRRFDEVYPENDLPLNQMQPFFWSEGLETYVTVPGTTAKEVYDAWYDWHEAHLSPEK